MIAKASSWPGSQSSHTTCFFPEAGGLPASLFLELAIVPSQSKGDAAAAAGRRLQWNRIATEEAKVYSRQDATSETTIS